MTDLKQLLEELEPPSGLDVGAVVNRGDALRRRRQRGKAACAAVLAVLVGVGTLALVRDPGRLRDEVSVVADASEAAATAGSARVKISIVMAADDQRTGASLEGIVEFDSGRGRLESDNGTHQVTILVSEGTTYVSVPEGERAATGGKPWLSHPTSSAQRDIVTFERPNEILNELRSAKDVKRVGEENVNGVDAVRYRTARRSTGDGISFEPYDVWVTDGGLLTRVALETDFSGLKISMGMDFTDFGIELPDLDLPSLDDVFAGDERVASAWIQPDLPSQFLDGKQCGDLNPILGGELPAQGLTEAQRKNAQRALGPLEERLQKIDRSNPEGAEQADQLEAMIANLRAALQAEGERPVSYDEHGIVDCD